MTRAFTPADTQRAEQIIAYYDTLAARSAVPDGARKWAGMADAIRAHYGLAETFPFRSHRTMAEVFRREVQS